MASVFKAYEASLDRYVALKVLPPEFLHDPTFAERFRREAQTIARLEHPQIIPIFAYDIDTGSGTPWMAMRLISGGSLSQRIKRGRLAPSECARILKDVGDALDYAHSAGVIHRDVKPQNVLLDDSGRVYLADFGIAKMVESTAQMTQTGMITGTPQYMAPEQALGKSIDKSIDIYALGIVAYELFTGRVPFSADTPVAVLMKQASEPMPLPPANEVQEEVTRAILRATAKDPAARWPSASAFARAISNAVTSTDSTAATGMMAAIGQETVAGMTAPGLAATMATAAGKTALNKTVVAPPQKGAKAVSPDRRSGAGMGVAALVLVGLALAGAAATYLAFRYWQGTQTPATVATAESPSPLPVLPASPEEAQTPVTPVATPVATPASEPTRAPAAAAATLPSSSTATPDPMEELKEIKDSLTPAQRRALMSMPRRERMAAIAAARRRLEAGGDPPNPPQGSAAATEERPAVQRASRTRINLEVEASQPSTGAQISALYAQVIIDDKPYREFVIRFSGGNSFARWKKVENIVLENVPLSAREITLAVATDSGL
ncbi:MAG: protein kinase, partial [Vicinamibacteria bacterium]